MNKTLENLVLDHMSQQIHPVFPIKRKRTYFVWEIFHLFKQVTKNSKVFGISRIDLTPLETTAIPVLPSSIKSAEISNVSSTFRCTPPIPGRLIPKSLQNIENDELRNLTAGGENFDSCFISYY